MTVTQIYSEPWETIQVRTRSRRKRVRVIRELTRGQPWPQPAQGGWSPILLFFSVRLLLNHDKNTSSNPHFLLLLYIQNILVKSIQFGWCFYSIPYNEKMWVTAGVFVMI